MYFTQNVRFAQKPKSKSPKAFSFLKIRNTVLSWCCGPLDVGHLLFSVLQSPPFPIVPEYCSQILLPFINLCLARLLLVYMIHLAPVSICC